MQNNDILTKFSTIFNQLVYEPIDGNHMLYALQGMHDFFNDSKFQIAKEDVDRWLCQLIQAGVQNNVNKNSDESLYNEYMEIIRLLISKFKALDRKTFGKTLCASLQDGIYTQSSIKLPFIYHPKEQLQIANKNQSHIHLYFDILQSFLNISFSIPENFFEIILNILCHTKDFSSEILHTLSCAIPCDHCTSLKLIRVLFCFMNNFAIKNTEIDTEIDLFAAKTLQHSCSRLPSYMRKLLSRDLISYIKFYQNIKLPMFLNEFFLLIKEFVESDHANHKLVSDLIFNNFKNFYYVTNYIELCKTLIKNNNKYLEYFTKVNFDSNPEIIPNLMEIFPKFSPNFSELSKFPQIFYKTIVKIEKPSLIHGSYLSRCLDTASPPLELINDLYKLFPNIILEKLDKLSVDFAIKIFEENNDLFKRYMSNAIDIASKSLSRTLMSMIIIYQKQNEIQLTDDFLIELKSNVKNVEAYKDKHYVNAVSMILKDEELLELYTYDFIKKLLSICKESCQILLDNKYLSFHILKLLMQILWTEDEILQGISLILISRMKDLSSIKTLYKYEFGSLLGNLFVQKETVFNELCTIIFHRKIQNHKNIISAFQKIIFPFIICTSEQNLQKFLEKSKLKLKDFLSKNIPSILEFIFTSNDEQMSKRAFEFFRKQKMTSLQKVVYDNSIRFFPVLFIDCVSPNEITRQKAIQSVKSIFESKYIEKSVLISKEEYFNQQIVNYFYFTLVRLTKIITSPNPCDEKLKMVIPTIKYLLPFIESELPKFITQIYTVLMRVCSIDILKLSWIQFWYDFCKTFSSKMENVCLQRIFVPLTQNLCILHKEFPVEISAFFRYLIIDLKEITEDWFKYIYYYPVLDEIIDVKHQLQKDIKLEWSDQIILLSHNLDDFSNLSFRNLCLETIRKLLKDHEEELYTNKLDIKYLTTKLWSVASHETDKDNAMLFGRILSLLPFTNDISEPHFDVINKDDIDKIIIKIITDYLVKILVNSQITLYAIQQMLAYLGCRDVTNDTQAQFSDERGLLNWSKFPDEIKTAINNCRSTSFKQTLPKETETALKPLIDSAHRFSLSRWMRNLFVNLITKVDSIKSSPSNFDYRKTDGGYLEPLAHPIGVSSALGYFVIPYLISYNSSNEVFINCLRKEWEYCYEKLRGNNKKQKTIARTVIQAFFSLFDSLERMKISASKDKILKGWTYLEIADEKKLAKSAYSCQLWQRALMHFDNLCQLSKENMTTKNLQLMKECFTNSGDLENANFLKKKLSEISDTKSDTALSEMNLLDEEEQRSQKILLIKEMVENGRFERALSDAKTIRSTVIPDLRLDSSICRSAMSLGKWDEIENIIHENCSVLTRDFDESRLINDANNLRFDISVAKSFYDLKFTTSQNFKDDIDIQKKRMTQELSESFLGSYIKLRQSLVKVRILDEMSLFADNREDYNLSLFKKWIDKEPLSLDILSRVTSINCAMIDLMEKNDKLNNLTLEWIDLSVKSRRNDNIIASEMHANRAHKMMPNNDLVLIELAKVSWCKKPSDTSINILNTIKPESDKQGKISFMKAQYLDKLNSLDADGLTELYKTITQRPDCEGKVHYQFATLIDQRIEKYINYVEIDGQEIGVSTKLRKMESVKFWGNTSSSMNIASFLKTQVPLCLKNYFLTIIKTPQLSNEVLPRIMDLFFETIRNLLSEQNKKPYSLISQNQKPTIIQQIKDVFKEYVNKVYPYVWFNSITQLISWIEQPSELSEFILQIICEATKCHPSSALWHLMYVNHSSSPLRKEKYENVIEMILKSFKNDEEKNDFQVLIQKFVNITSGLIQLTELPYQSRETIKVNASELCPELVKNFDNCQISMPITSAFRDDRFSRTPKICQMEEPTLIFMSQQRPKRISLRDETGNSHRFLCKRDDDLRKDMRMMEFASFVNNVLESDKKCRHRLISMNVFSIVCLNEKNGLIEWVNHTICFRKILNELYESRNLGMPLNDILDILGQDSRYNPQKKCQLFCEKIIPKFPPLSHLWFLDNFKDASQWFVARQNYTRSTAVWSMVGYIVGLGDRHLENILFNKTNGSVVHVDFCYMFDKAKTLPTPECVPFRLTQNVVDAMGALGVEGSFTSSCILMMDSLKAKANKIVTTLQTFVQDPLLEWKKVSKDFEEMAAQRTIKEVERRVMGFSEDRARKFSTEFFVRDLIQKAQDPNNLSRMWEGWQAYL
ncbi:PIKK family atypical protein kinase [Trichomonas vaginalis G3]|uniref:Serine/threonine-protein kinase ATR n=1 Tax=Trichomonas vaginalis (strain ATCC PRA-98 / G3) TaxID=412133 RepID=A2DII8_TRIV3|nr:ataxia telangiectasia mutated (ATM) -related family [Trichomonas vaginalis G3]EAY19792.1 PIKK family atypical protein kinase [Trichomonas vaginalis G3]KAI5523996.1 ataxia telangiectasia mutated (ATM) -related family [Trichomonas vaginalis G3]|eukprot:XP_001580778.1 PIKK family atypical protein kinase [Trichomonas vaginalis G3]